MIFHTSIRTFGRAKGHNALDQAAYRGALLLTDPVTQKVYDYRGRAGVLRVRCMVPPNSPHWSDDPQALWAAAEAAEKRKDSTVCRNFQVALPHELDDEQRWGLTLDIAKALVDRYGFALQVSHHAPTSEDPRNFFAHLLATTRKMEPQGLTVKTRMLDGRINGKDEVEWIRLRVLQEVEQHLAMAEAPIVPSVQSTLAERLEVRRQAALPVDLSSAPFDQLLSRYRDQARLLGVPEGHSHEVARRDRDREAGQVDFDECERTVAADSAPRARYHPFNINGDRAASSGDKAP
jgi:hypothetical protein